MKERDRSVERRPTQKAKIQDVTLLRLKRPIAVGLPIPEMHRHRDILGTKLPEATRRYVFSKRKMLLVCGKEQKSGTLSRPGAGAELHMLRKHH